MVSNVQHHSEVLLLPAMDSVRSSFTGSFLSPQYTGNVSIDMEWALSRLVCTNPSQLQYSVFRTVFRHGSWHHMRARAMTEGSLGGKYLVFSPWIVTAPLWLPGVCPSIPSDF